VACAWPAAACLSIRSALNTCRAIRSRRRRPSDTLERDSSQSHHRVTTTAVVHPTATRASHRFGAPSRGGSGLTGPPVPSVEGRVVARGPGLAEPRRAQIPVRADLAGRRARSEALTACIITRRPFRAGAEGPWASARRGELVDQQARAREVVAEALLRGGDHRQAAREAAAAVRLDPCRETAYRQLMRVRGGRRPWARAAGLRPLPPGAPRRAGVDLSPDTLELHGQLIRAG
jgi:hypothetical protein